MSTTTQIQNSIHRRQSGQPFLSTSLLKYGSRAAVDKALSRLVNAGKLVRLTRGIYVRPEENRFIGKISPPLHKIIETIAKKTHETIQVSGAEAARRFHFTTQVPIKPVFLTTGRSRHLKIGHLEIHLKHVSKKKIPLSKKKAGLAIVALWYLGKDEVSTGHISKIKKQLTSEEFKQFVSAREKMPVWMSDIVFRFEKDNSNA